MHRSSLRARMEERAGGRCEYCQAPQSICGYHFHLEHVVPVALGGSDAESNRALACASCNLAKSDRVSGRDPLTGDDAPLFHPRMQDWHNHFCRVEDQRTLLGLTATGRATVAVLDMNSELRQAARQLCSQWGCYPRTDEESRPERSPGYCMIRSPARTMREEFTEDQKHKELGYEAGKKASNVEIHAHVQPASQTIERRGNRSLQMRYLCADDLESG